MKKILVIGSRSTEPNETQAVTDMATYVQNSLEKTGLQARTFSCHLDEVGYVIKENMLQVIDLKNSTDLTDYDLVFFRGKLAASINVVSTIAQYLDMNQVPHVNTAYAKRRPVGKLPQIFQLFNMGLPMPATVSAAGPFMADLAEAHLQYPMIVKDIQGAHGNNNFLVHDRKELDAVIKANPMITFMAQAFIPNDGDYRVLLIGEQTAIIHRQASGDTHLNNTSVGGKATLVPLETFPAAIVKESRRFADACDYEIAGVDVIIDRQTKQHYFLEINSQPQLINGAFVDVKSEMLAKYFKDLLNR